MSYFNNPEICKPEAAAELKEIMGDNKALVISRLNCEFTPHMLDILDKYQISHTTLELDQTFPPMRTIDFANCIYNKDPRKVPFLILNGKNFGTYEHLHASATKGI